MQRANFLMGCVVLVLVDAAAFAVNLGGGTINNDNSSNNYSGNVGTHSWSCSDPDLDGLPESVTVDGLTVPTTSRPYVGIVNMVNVYVGTAGNDTHSYAGNA